MARKKNTHPPLAAKSAAKLLSPPEKNSLILFFENKRNQLWMIGLMAILLYGNTLWNQYALDDGMVLKENKFVQRGISGIPDILSHDSFYGSIGDTKNLSGGRYRPLSLIFYAVEVSLFGNSAFFHHLLNILFYALTAIILLFLLRKFIFNQHPLAAFTAALLFVIHPIHTEVVANIKSRDEIFSLLFLILTLYYLLSFIIISKKKIHFALSLFFYLLALFSKENGLTFLAVIPVTLYFFTTKKIREVFILSIPYILVAAFYIFIRITLIGAKNNEVTEIMDNPYLLATSSEKYATILFVLLKYLQLLVWPHPLTYDYSYNQIPYRNFSDGCVLLSLAIYLLMAGYAIMTFKRKDLLGWCIIFYLASIFIVSNIIFNIGAPMAERFLFQASVAFVIFAVELTRRILQRFSLSQKRKINLGLACLIPITVVSAFTTIARNNDWKSNEVLFLHDVKTSSRSARANTYAGVALIQLCDQSKDNAQKRRYALEALQYFRKSSTIKVDYITTLLNMGVAFSRLDSLEQAEAAWDKARQADPTDKNLKLYDQYLAETYYGRGLKEGADKNYTLSIQYLEKAVKYGPHHAEAWYNLGGAYFTIHDYEKAKICWAKTLQLSPKHAPAQEGLNALERLGSGEVRTERRKGN